MRLIVLITLCITIINPLDYAFANTIQFKPQQQYTNPWNQKTIASITFPANIPTETKNYYWVYNGNSYYFTFQVPTELLEWNRSVNEQINYFYELGNYKKEEQYLKTSPIKDLIVATKTTSQGNYTSWINESKNASYIKLIATQLNNQAIKDGYNDFQKAEFILGFVQSMPYFVVDTKLPAQTLVDYGDCDCRSILYASIMKELGYKVGLVKLYDDVDHMATIVSLKDDIIPEGYESYYIKGNDKYYYCETIGECAMIGDELELGNNIDRNIHLID